VKPLTEMEHRMIPTRANLKSFDFMLKVNFGET
jgi:hypothetical protein